MSLTDIFQPALSGLQAAQAGLRGVAANIANAQTPGYSRETVQFVPQTVAGAAIGVRALDAERIANRFLETAQRTTAGDAGFSETQAFWLTKVSNELGAPGSARGLPEQLSDVQASAIALAANGADPNARSAFAVKVGSALSEVARVTGAVGAARGDVDAELTDSIPRINNLLLRIQGLNEVVVRADAIGRTSTGDADNRAAALDELSKLIGITTHEGQNGRIDIDTKGGQVLLDRRARSLDYGSAPGGSAAPVHAAIRILAIDPGTGVSTPTGEDLDLTASGGKVGALGRLRDGDLPNFVGKLNDLAVTLGRALNAASNGATASPAPATLTGRNTGLAGSDPLRATGLLTIDAVSADGTVAAQVRLDLSTVVTADDLVAQVNSASNGKLAASFNRGVLVIAAAGDAAGVAFDDRGTRTGSGSGFGQAFGLNDIVTATGAAIAPSALQIGDAHGATPGQTITLALYSSQGRPLASGTVAPAAVGTTIGDTIAAFNASPLGGFGRFGLSTDGMLAFAPSGPYANARVAVTADSTDRAGTGITLTSLLNLDRGSDPQVGASLALRRQVADEPGRLPVAALDSRAVVGSVGVAKGDYSQAQHYVDAFTSNQPSLDVTAARTFGLIGEATSQAKTQASDTAARADDAFQRRANFSGVNVDEELANMVILQNAYSASARVLATARDMLDTLLQIVH